MVIVMLAYEKGQVEKPHRRLEARVKRRARPGAVVRCFQPVDQHAARFSEPGQQIGQRAGVVVRLMGPPVVQVGRPESGTPGSEVVDPPKPQRLEISQVAHVLLNAPAVGASPGEHQGRKAPGPLFEPARRSPKPLQEIRRHPDGKIEGELALEPGVQGHGTVQSGRRGLSEGEAGIADQQQRVDHY